MYEVRKIIRQVKITISVKQKQDQEATLHEIVQCVSGIKHKKNRIKTKLFVFILLFILVSENNNNII